MIAHQTWIRFPTFRECSRLIFMGLRPTQIRIRLQGIKLPPPSQQHGVYTNHSRLFFSVFWVFFLTIYSLVELSFSAGRSVFIHQHGNACIVHFNNYCVHLHPQITLTSFQCIQLALLIYPRLKALSRTTCNWPSKLCICYLISFMFFSNSRILTPAEQHRFCHYLIQFEQCFINYLSFVWVGL